MTTTKEEKQGTTRCKTISSLIYVVSNNLVGSWGSFILIILGILQILGAKQVNKSDTIWVKSSQLNNIIAQAWVNKEILSNQDFKFSCLIS